MDRFRRGYLKTRLAVRRMFRVPSGSQTQADSPSGGEGQLLTVHDVSDVPLRTAISRYLELHRLSLALARSASSFTTFMTLSTRLLMGLDALDGVMVCNGVHPAFVGKRIRALIEKYDPVASNWESLLHLRFFCGSVMDFFFDMFGGQPVSQLTEFKAALEQLSSELRQVCDERESDSGPPNVCLLIETLGRAIISFALIYISGQYRAGLPSSPSNATSYIGSPIAHHSTDTNYTPCIFGSRALLLEALEDWMKGNWQSRMHVLEGMPGHGKSTMAHAVAVRARALGYLGAKIFLTRQDSATTPINIFHSIAAQLWAHYVDFFGTHRHELSHLLMGLDYHGSSMDSLVRLLRICPWYPTGGFPYHPVVIIVDTLDECEERGLSLLRGFYELVKAIPFLRILVTTRPSSSLEAFIVEETSSTVSVSTLRVEDIGYREDIWMAHDI